MTARPTPALRAGFAAAVCLLLFAWLAREVLRGDTLPFDTAVRSAVHARAFPLLTWAMRGVTQLGSSWWLLAFGAIAVWRLVQAGRRRAALILVAASAGAEALEQILKLVFHRSRPEAFFGLDNPWTYSFPSGHAAISACFYGLLAAILTARIESRRRRAACWVLAVFVALLVGFSRVYLGFHYPTDVIAGYALAVIWVAAVRAIAVL